MQDPQGIYEVDHDAVARTLGTADEGGPAAAPVLVHAVRGFVDAGATGELAAEHLLGSFTPTRLVTFDVDQLVDYRSRRPPMTFDADRWAGYDAPVLALDHLADDEGTGFLLLHGTEPDLQWERAAAAVRRIVDELGVSLTVGLHGIPMAVPHTRPLTLTVHGTREGLVDEQTTYFGRVQVPGSWEALLEYRLGETEHDAMGFAVHVPHYLGQSRYVPAAVLALQQLEKATGLALHTGALDEAAGQARVEVAELVAENEEVASVVHQLEEQYDAFARSVGRQNLLAEDSSLPTAEELGAEFERFLAERGDD
ncbi:MULTISPECIES: PAC2 family protein [unclassified Isoptericola]|uniref:PAC2 family protein n=1 Tax=unclassified Isoptericola TaxID=2623355 RepID=UPI002713AD3D|nr:MULTISPECIES: PAC2 family protein [unclassified Isoptericola]MDO8144650.1 PAC2 family protein [Isoptericola sp. 178]MDO8148496.1 PAC2 family protein [Isoptericola sp. b515]MDO8151975.1 PAC2 family protein [Isoptericola sp. b408]